MAPRLCTVLAHPDDETFGTGGALIRAVSRGAEVHSLCLTKGEAGWAGDPDAPIATRETLGDVRAQELRDAGAIIGLASVTVRDWGDGKLASAAGRQVEDDILAWLREHRPDVVISWGPDGAYGHPDHIAAGERCLAAIARLDEPRPKKVYRFVIHASVPDYIRRHIPEWTSILDSMVGWRDADLGALLTLTDAEIARKWEAMRQHRSQAPDLKNYARVMAVDPRAFRYEAYLRAHPPQDGRLETELL